MKKKSSKRYKKLFDTFKDKKISTLDESIKKVKQSCTAKFDESIDVSLNLNLKQKKENFILRTVVNLPHGNGKKIKVGVLCEEGKISEAKNSGADISGSDTLVEEIMSGKINFDKLIATPAMMSKMGNNMELEPILHQAANKRREAGLMGKELIGYLIQNKIGEYII